MGLRWSESQKRSKRKRIEVLRKGTNTSQVESIALNPIIDFTDENIWDYIRSRNMPYCSLYDEGFKRLGCIMCPQQEKTGMLRDARRWPAVAYRFRKIFQALVEARIADGRPYVNWKTGDCIYDWWIENKRNKDDTETCQMFAEKTEEDRKKPAGGLPEEAGTGLELSNNNY
jgi:phosphoadenosine phosphosulfate reductase